MTNITQEVIELQEISLSSLKIPSRMQEATSSSRFTDFLEIAIEPQEKTTGKFLTCEICFEPIDSNQLFRNSKRCCHNSYCKTCISSYIQAKLQEYNTPNIVCPGLNCVEPLDPIIARSIVPPQIFTQWCDTLSENLLTEEGVQRSYCPHPGCSTSYISECKNISYLKCLKCENSFCFRCKIPWSVDHECLKHRNTEGISDAAFTELLAKNKWARCPQCGHVIQRISGCSHVKCRCGVIFSYGSGKFLSENCSCRECRNKFWAFVSVLGSILVFLLIIFITLS